MTVNMKRLLSPFAALLLVFLFGSAGQACAGPAKKSYVIGFYNLENLFDT